MANVIVNLPLPVLNGAGAAVNTATMGSSRTIICGGSFPGATVTVEGSVDGGVTWGPICTFSGQGDKRVVVVVAEQMRVNVSGRTVLVPFAANIDIGSDDIGSLFAGFPLPAFNGVGAPVDISAHGRVKTIIAAGAFGGGTVTVEVSEDGVAWAPCGIAFSAHGRLVTTELVAHWARARVAGRRPGVAFSATIALGSANDSAASTSLWPLATTFVFRPGGVPDANVYTTWASLMADLVLIEGEKVIQFDDSLVSPCVIPAGGPYPMVDVIWEGYDSQWAGIDVADGASFTNGGPRVIRNYLYIMSRATVSPCVLSRYDEVELRNYVDVSVAVGAAPFWSTAGLAAGHSCAFSLRDWATLQWYGTAGLNVIDHSVVGGRLYIAAWDVSYITNCVSGIVGALLYFNRYGAASLIYPQPSFLGTIDWIQNSAQIFAANPDYPGVPSAAALTPQHGQWIRLAAGAAGITQALRIIADIVPPTTQPVSSGAWTLVTNSGVGRVTVDANGADTIDGQLTYVIPPGGAALFISDGISNWSVVSMYGPVQPSTFVFRPGGVATKNVYTSWSTLVAALATVQGPKRIEFDDSLGAIQIPAGGPYDMTDVEWTGAEGLYGGARPYVQILDGASFTNLRTFRHNLRVGNSCVAVAPITDVGDTDRIRIVDNVDLFINFGCGPMIEFAGGGVGDAIDISVEDNSSIGFYNPNIPVINVPQTREVDLYVGNGCTVWNGTFTGIGTATLFLSLLSPSGRIMAPQAGWVGTIIWRNVQDQAFRLNPGPGVAPVGAVATPEHGSFIRVDSTAAVITQALPQLAGAALFNGAGRWCAIKDVATNGLYGVTVDPPGAETINGVATYAIPPGGAALFIADGVGNWTAIGIDMNHVLNRLNTFTRAQGTAQVALADDVAGIVADLTLSNSFRCNLGVVLGNTRQLAAPTGAVAGFTYIFEFVQPTAPDAVQALTFLAASWKFPGGVIPALTATNDAKDILTFYYDGDAMQCVAQNDLRNP